MMGPDRDTLFRLLHGMMEPLAQAAREAKVKATFEDFRKQWGALQRRCVELQRTTFRGE